MKTFRDWDVDQDWLLPPSLGEFVPADHVAHFIRDLVRNELDLTCILSSYEHDYPTETDRFTQAAAGCIRGLNTYSLRTLSFASTSTSDTS
jgi:hypothetical protein